MSSAIVTPSLPRFHLTEGSGGITITIPTRKNWYLILFMGFWLCAWLAGWLFGAAALIFGDWDGTKLFLFGWFGAWTVGGAFALTAWLNNVSGREIVRVDGSTISIGRQITRFDALADVRDLRVAPLPAMSGDWSSAMTVWGLGGGQVAFDYGARTIRLGTGLDEAEAKIIVAEITRRYSIHG